MAEWSQRDAENWSANVLVADYVEVMASKQLDITQEYNPCATGKHDKLLPKHITIMRPTLASERGVALFCGYDVPHLRNVYAYGQPIEELVRVLTNLLKRRIRFHDLEIVAFDESRYGLAPYSDGDGKSYAIHARYPDWREREKKAQRKAKKKAEKRAVKERERWRAAWRT